MRRFVLRFLIFFLLVYLGLCLAMFLVQRSLIYYPVKQSHRLDTNAALLKINGEEIVVAQSDPRIVDLNNSKKSGNERGLPVSNGMAIVYFGGNAEDVSLSLPRLQTVFSQTPIYAMHYRSYGGSSGEPTQDHLFADALALIDRLRPHYQRIVVMGRSLGSGIAVYTASQTPVEALILVTPYFSLEDVAANQYPYLPARFLLRDKYASYQYAPAIKAPVYMLVAEWDQLTPLEGSVALQRKFAPGQAQMVVVKQAWHNGISNKPEYNTALSEMWKTINQR